MLLTDLLCSLGRRVAADRLFCALLAALPLLALGAPRPRGGYLALIDWQTLGLLAGLIVLSQGLLESGALHRCGERLLAAVRTERGMAVVLVALTALLSMVVTNDAALIVMVPLTVTLRFTVESLPVGRFVVFEALAANTGSLVSPIGNPQNLYLWQSAGIGAVAFMRHMAPLLLTCASILGVAIVAGFAGRITRDRRTDRRVAVDTKRFALAATLYPVFLLLADYGYTSAAAGAALGIMAVGFPAALRRADWLLLAVFALMFVDVGLAVHVPAVQTAVDRLADCTGGDGMLASAAVSQVVSNVPAALLMRGLGGHWLDVAWGANVGGYGLAVGSLANIIALRLGRQQGLWAEFHRWSIPFLLAAAAAALAIR